MNAGVPREWVYTLMDIDIARMPDPNTYMYVHAHTHAQGTNSGRTAFQTWGRSGIVGVRQRCFSVCASVCVFVCESKCMCE